MTTELACPGGRAWKDVIMSKPYPEEVRDDVVRVARGREPGVTVEQIARDFGVHPMTLRSGCAVLRSRREPGPLGLENHELRKRLRLVEQENEVLRRPAAYLSQANLPGKGGART